MRGPAIATLCGLLLAGCQDDDDFGSPARQSLHCDFYNLVVRADSGNDVIRAVTIE